MFTAITFMCALAAVGATLVVVKAFRYFAGAYEIIVEER
jgi:hypothetical protein